MKIIDKYILRSFLPPFLATFFIVLMVLAMQVLWLWSDDIIGKGIDTLVIIEMMLYLCASMVPMALPLAILISSIMSFGNLSENSELTAFKAAGIPLSRIMRSLMIFILFVSLGAFYFSNNVIPYVNFKFENMISNIVNQKPALNIVPGAFVQLGDFSIRVEKKIDKKEGKNQYSEVEGVLIYDFSKMQGTTGIISAERGVISSSKDKRFMILTLFNGHMYEEESSESYKDRVRQQMSKSSFEKQIYPIDISSFLVGDMKRESDNSSWSMLNINQLKKQIDTISTSYKQYLATIAGDFKMKSRIDLIPVDTLLKKDSLGVIDTLKSISSYIPKSSQDRELFKTYLKSRLEEQSSFLNDNVQNLRWNSSHLNRFELEIQKKYALAFSIIVLFFVGAPLGALIRKGGMGLPMVVAILIYLVYHILLMSGERMGIQGSLDSITARWLPTFILFPFGVWLTYRATKDATIINYDPILILYDKVKLYLKTKISEYKKNKAKN